MSCITHSFFSIVQLLSLFQEHTAVVIRMACRDNEIVYIISDFFCVQFLISLNEYEYNRQEKTTRKLWTRKNYFGYIQEKKANERKFIKI